MLICRILIIQVCSQGGALDADQKCPLKTHKFVKNPLFCLKGPQWCSHQKLPSPFLYLYLKFTCTKHLQFKENRECFVPKMFVIKHVFGRKYHFMYH